MTHEVEFNARLRAFAKHWGFRPHACAPYRARTEGKDERGVGYVKKNGIAGRRFESWSALEAHPGGLGGAMSPTSACTAPREVPIDLPMCRGWPKPAPASAHMLWTDRLKGWHRLGNGISWSAPNSVCAIALDRRH